VNKTTQTVESAAAGGAFHIEDIYPQVDGGRFAVKRIVGEPFEVWADIYRDGHDVMAASLVWRREHEREWRRVPMAHDNNDRWGGAFVGTELVAVALEYAGLSPQPLFVMGRNDGIEATLRDLVKPRAAYVAALPAALPAVESSYRVDPGPQMVRMWVDRSTSSRGIARPRNFLCQCISSSGSPNAWP